MILTKKTAFNIKSFLVVFILFSFQLHAQLMPSLIGDANDIGGDCFEITENINNQSGAVWSGTAIDMTNDFIVEFRGFFGTNDANGADGIVFILKNSSTPEIGNLGGGMGYEGINNSLAVEFDTWQNNDLGDPFFDHLAIISNGVNNHNAATNLAGPIQASATTQNIENGVEHIIRIEWTAATTTLDVYFDCDLRLSYSGDVVNNIFSGITDAYFGFTGSTGGAANLQRVCFDYVSFANSLSLDDQNICPGNIVDSVDATVTGATTYTWMPTTGVSDPNIANPTFNPITTTTYTVSITNSCAEIIQDSFTITVNPLPTANPINDFAVCDDVTNDGIAPFDFTTLNNTVLGTQDPNMFNVSYHLSLSDANGNLNPLTFPYTNTTICEEIFVRVENNMNVACYDTTDFEVCVNTQPIANQPNNIILCDTGNDGTETYDLSTQFSDILNTQNAPDFNITFHANQTDADTNMNSLPSMHTGMNNETIFVRIESTQTGNDCFDTTSFQLLLNEIPIANTIADFSVCDDASNDGINAFDFTNLDITALGTLDPTLFSVTYYSSQANADNRVNALVFPYSNTAQCEQIYVRVENNANTTCYDTTNFEVCLNTQPIANQPNSIVVCDFDNNGSEIFDLNSQFSDILGAQNPLNFNITFHTNQTDADTDMNSLPAMYTGMDNETIFVRIESTQVGNDCYDTTSFELQFDIPPVVTMPTDLIVCDDEISDGFTTIDLNIKNAEIVNNQPGLSVQYYLNQVDADNDTNPLTIPYTNISNPQTVYVRVESGNLGCYVTTSLIISIVDAPTVFPVTDLEYCDTDNDGFGIFDIRSTENQATGGIMTNISVTYHETPEDADNNVSVLPDNYTNINAYNQTIYVRVENVLTGCFNVVPLNLIVHDAPEIAAMDATILAECDTDTDGIAQFDLTQSEPDILNGEDPLTHDVSYYNSQTNATLGNGTGEINNVNAYSNIPPSPQTIWVRVEDLATGCFTVTNLTLVVNELPTLVQLPALELCDAISLGDGIEVFDLTSLAEDLLNSAPGISLNYYANAADLASDTPIADPTMYSNVEIGVQTIFVRATNDTTGCQNTITFDIRVNPLPSPTLDPNGTLTADICDEDNDGFQLFDLDDLVNDIINNEPDVVYSFHETLENAQQNLFPLASPYTNIMMDSQTIYVLATNTVTGCITITPLELSVTPIPVLPLVITDLEECDDAMSLDGFDMFDLTQTQTEIYGTQTPGDFTLTYHESEVAAQNDLSPIVNLTNYTNIVANQQTIWVRLEHNTTECFAIGSFDIIVVGPPVLVQPIPFALCDDAQSGDESDEITSFDLTDKYTEITGGDTSLTLAYYANAADLASDTPIADPSAYQNTDNPQVIYIRATNAAGCTTDITMTLRVLPIPTPNTMPEPLTACDDDIDGILVFDLTLSEAEIVDNENNVTVSYHITEMDAMDDASAIVDPTMHTIDMATANADGQVIIYVRVESDLQIDSNMLPCYKVVELPVIVYPLPALTDTAFTYVFCEYDNDNVGQFDWDVVTASLDLLSAPQDITNFTVTYHPTVADALAGTAALVNGFENTTDPQTVFIRVENIATECVNTNNIASLELSVEPIPTATTPDTYELCADDQADQNTAVFDLTSLDAAIINGQTDMEVVYYETATDADMDTNAIANASSYTNTANPQTLYARVRQTITGCLSDPILVNLQVNPLPVFTLPADDILCVDATTGQALDIRTIGVDFGAGYTYQWTTPSGTATTATVQVTEAGTYSVTVTDMNHPTNCSFDDSVTYEASSAPSTLDIAVNTPAFADTHNVTATASGGSGSYEYQLDDGTWQADGVFTDLQPGQHTITVRDTNGCGEIVRTFGLIDFMEFFTPNGDAYNATWNIIGLQNQPSAKIFIFDRYGKLLKQISPAGAGWDGTYNGNVMPSADYWFRVEYVDPFDGTPKEFINHFTLKR